MSDKRNKMGRRDFLKLVSGGVTALSASSFVGCKPATDQRGGESSNQPTSGGMAYRENPKTGDKVSLLGYGMMRLPQLKKGDAAGENTIDQEMTNELVDHAIANGVNYFDTAPVYGKGFSEEATGIALSRHPRDKYFIATKMSNFDPLVQTREKSIEMYQNSLKKLRVDYIDYMLLHAVGPFGGMETYNNRFVNNGILDFLLEEREAGRIRNLGFSYHGEVEVFDYLLSKHDEYKWDFVQIQANYLDWKYAKQVNPINTNSEYLLGELIKRNIPAVIMEPLLGGRLAKLPDHLSARMQQRRPNDSIASWAFRYIGSLPNVLTALSGMTYMEHLEDNLKTFSPLEPLSEDEFDFLDEIARGMMEYPLVSCTACQYCMPCPYGIDIPAIFAHYNKCVSESNFPEDNQDPEYKKARQAFLVGYDRSVPKLRQADHCIGCGKCLEHCPQKIEIPKELSRINDYVERLKQGK